MMNFRKSFTKVLILLLVFANVLTLGMFWFNRDRPRIVRHAGGPAEFIIKELNLNKDQQAKYLELVAAHQQSVKNVRANLKEAKDDFFDLLNEPGVTESKKTDAAKKVSEYTERIDIITLDHFAALRALCNPVQQQKFANIMKEVTRMMVQPGPEQPEHGGPPPDGDMPRHHLQGIGN